LARAKIHILHPQPDSFHDAQPGAVKQAHQQGMLWGNDRQHILPGGFVKIRHYGLLDNRQRQQRLDQARQLLAAARPAAQEMPAATRMTR
jgi:hypothetical protein